MTRFAGKFEPMSLRSGGVGSSADSAASAVSVGDIFSGIRESSPKFDQIADTAMQTASAEKQAQISADAQVEAAEIGAEASIKAAEKSASASKTGSMFGAIGSIAGAGLSLIPGLG